MHKKEFHQSVGLVWHGCFFRDTHFLGPLELRVNGSPKSFIVKTLSNPRNIFLIHQNIILYHVSFIKYLWISKILLSRLALKSTVKYFIAPFNPIFFMLSIVKIFEILPKYNGCGFICESFALNWYIFTVLINKKLLLPLKCSLNTNFLLDCVKLIEYLASAAILVSSDPHVRTSHRTNIFSYYQHEQNDYHQLQK